MNIVFLDTKTIGDVPNLKDLKKFGETTFYKTTSHDQTAERIKEAEIVITNKVVLNRELIEGADNLKLICVAATGMNNIDREAADKSGISVKNVSGYSSNSVAQTTFAMILHLVQKISQFDGFVKSGDYSRHDIFTNQEITFSEIHGKQFGIIGLGDIGSKVASIAEEFGADVVYYSTSGRNLDQPYPHLELNKLLKSSHFISIHAPLNKNTEGLIGYDQMKLMKKSAILINAGRGGIVNEVGLAKALDEDQIGGAGLDVFNNEPMEKENPLLSIKNKHKLVMTPHIAWASIEARTELIDGVKKNIEEFLEG